MQGLAPALGVLILLQACCQLPTAAPVWEPGVIDADSLAQIKLLEQQVLRAEYEAALGLSEKLIKATQVQVKAARIARGHREQSTLHQFLFAARFERIKALVGAQRPFEAMVNALRLRAFCKRHLCRLDQLDSLAGKISDIEGIIRNGQGEGSGRSSGSSRR